VGENILLVSDELTVSMKQSEAFENHPKHAETAAKEKYLKG